MTGINQKLDSWQLESAQSNKSLSNNLIKENQLFLHWNLELLLCFLTVIALLICAQFHCSPF